MDNKLSAKKGCHSIGFVSFGYEAGRKGDEIEVSNSSPFLPVADIGFRK
jgi:hypothetical protein